MAIKCIYSKLGDRALSWYELTWDIAGAFNVTRPDEEGYEVWSQYAELADGEEIEVIRIFPDEVLYYTDENGEKQRVDECDIPFDDPEYVEYFETVNIY